MRLERVALVGNRWRRARLRLAMSMGVLLLIENRRLFSRDPAEIRGKL